tara:strand:- start:40735 stop:41448 length:714 start_codon:yes stop_codon:yes gene_type:complete
MIRRCFLLSLINILFAHDPKLDTPEWTSYSRVGYVNVIDNSGLATYTRVKRTTNYSFRDLRLYANIFEKEQDIRLRQKSSRIFITIPWIYNFTTISYQRNTLVDISLRYHYNQGIGFFFKKREQNNTTIELGMAYDMSDYLNDTRRTSYAKLSLKNDKSFRKMSSKIEINYFQQITDVNTYNLSRFQTMIEVYIKTINNFNLIVGGYQEFPRKQNFNNKNTLYYFTINWKRTLEWSL